MTEDTIKREVTPLSSKWWRVSVKEEYKRVPKLSCKQVKEIAEWLTTQPHLPPLNDNQIIIFLRACELDIRRTKELIDLHYTVRTQMWYFFSRRDIHSEALRNAIDVYQLAKMPMRDPKTGSIVFCSKVLPTSISLFDANETSKLQHMALDITQLTDGSAPGYIFLFDAQNYSFSHFLRSPIGRSADNCRYFQEVSTCVLKKFHFVRTTWVLKKLVSVLKPFVKAEIWSKISFHTDDQSLFKELDPRCVPSNYGGSGPSLEELSKQTVADLIDHHEWFCEEEKLMRVNEALRPSKNK